jgi:hypothetical protein
VRDLLFYVGTTQRWRWTGEPLLPHPTVIPTVYPERFARRERRNLSFILRRKSKDRSIRGAHKFEEPDVDFSRYPELGYLAGVIARV